MKSIAYENPSRVRAPSLALGATQGSLVKRVQRLSFTDSRQTLGVGSLVIMVLALSLAVGLGWTVLSVERALAQDDTSGLSETSLSVGGQNRSLNAKELAIELHRSASQIDTLPNFYIRANAGTRTFKSMANPSPKPLENLIRALDEPVVEEDWFRYEKTFAWDSRRFIDKTYGAFAFGPDQPEAKSQSANPPSWHTRWGTANIGGERSQIGEKPPFHVLRASANEMWKDNTVSNPNYLLATTHKFWWGDNSYRHQCFSSIPPELAEYRRLKAEEFDGETCDVIESPTRQERLWLSRKTGRLRGYLLSSFDGPQGDFFKSDAVQEITGRSFATQHEYSQWYLSEYEKLSKEKQLQLTLAWLKTQDYETARPTLLVRFRDYREVSPGVWWPFHEDRAQGFPSDGGYQCMLSTYRVQETRTDVNLEKAVNELQPKEGETVQDQRFVVPVQYQYRSDRSKEEILQLVDAKQQERLQDEKTITRLKEPYQKMIGKPAPQLPAEGWVGGMPSQLAGQPYLIHFWAVWCGPCKNDYPLLSRMAKDGAKIIGLHPEGTDASEVEKVVNEANLGYPTFLASSNGASGENRQIASYPATMFPYCVLVDAKGIVVGHGSLTENNGELISKFRELREQARGK